jgi:hypothetical protein
MFSHNNLDTIRLEFIRMIARYIGDEYAINLPYVPRDRDVFQIGKNLTAKIKAKIKVTNIMTRSVDCEITFMNYKQDFIFYISTNKGLVQNIDAFHNKIKNIIWNKLKQENQYNYIRKENAKFGKHFLKDVKIVGLD